MIDFLIKSTTSLAVLLVFYHLLLMKEKMYRFNRYYLLSAIIFSLAIPFITIPVYAEVTAATPVPFEVISAGIQQPVHHDDTIDYWPLIIWALYLIGTLIFAARFVNNIVKLNRQASGNTVIYKTKRIVLLNEKTLPFTFFNTIFLSKYDYEKGIEPELLTHELAHATQKHTLDVLFTEIVLIVLWFNPLLYFYKHSIQLNHEFLADDAVINNSADVTSYQQLLLGKMLPPVTYSFVSSLNFSLTKTRFTMMTKKSSKTSIAIKQLCLLPVMALIIGQMCIDVQAQVNENPKSAVAKAQPAQAEVTPDEYFKGVRFIAYERGVKDNNAANGMRATGKVLVNKKFEDLTAEERDLFRGFLFVPKRIIKMSPTQSQIDKYKNSKKYAIWIDGVNVPNSTLNKYNPEDIAYYSGSSVLKNARTKKHPQPFQYWFYTHKYFDTNNMGAIPIKYKGDTVEMWKDTGAAQDSEVINYDDLDVKPEYPGGLNELYAFISKKFKINSSSTNSTVYLEFTIEKSGAVSNLKAVKTPTPELGQSVIDVFPTDVKWSPGIKNKKPVRVKMQLPVRVHIE